jgi:hypothetical protein
MNGIKGKGIGTLLVMGVVYVGVIVAVQRVQRAASSPDFGVGIRMKAWRGVKGFADARSEWWGDIGLKAATRYQRCRNGI